MLGEKRLQNGRGREEGDQTGCMNDGKIVCEMRAARRRNRANTVIMIFHGHHTTVCDLCYTIESDLIEKADSKFRNTALTLEF